MSKAIPIAPNKHGRYYVNIPPYYLYMLAIEAWLKGRSLPEEAGSLLCSKLGEREGKRVEMLALLAERMGITPQALRDGIMNGSIATDLTYTDTEEPTDTE
jgi:hypothetical protein